MSETKFTHIKQLPPPSCYVRLVDHFVSQTLHFPKNGQLFSETLILVIML